MTKTQKRLEQNQTEILDAIRRLEIVYKNAMLNHNHAEAYTTKALIRKMHGIFCLEESSKQRLLRNKKTA